MKKLIFTLVLVIGCFFAAYSQNYKSAIGLRLGYPVSVSYKHFISEPGAIEGFLGFRSYSGYSWVNVGATYQHHFAIPDVDGLSWYVGGGASVFFWNDKDDFFAGNDDFNSTSFGILGVLGLDYKFPSAPINLSVDWMPTIFINGYGSGFGGGYGALSARYVLK
jgi:hypothetical protein